MQGGEESKQCSLKRPGVPYIVQHNTQQVCQVNKLPTLEHPTEGENLKYSLRFPSQHDLQRIKYLLYYLTLFEPQSDSGSDEDP